jgi:hypothetical protein
MIDVLAATGVLAGKEVFTSLVKDVYQLVVDQTGRRIKQWDTDRKISNLYSKLDP